MIELKDIYAATNDGLDIIMYYYPQALKDKKFSIREERTPSATMKKLKDVWRVTDFGDEGTALSPVDIVMKEEHCTFREAVLKLADRYGVANSLSPAINKPEIRQEPAADDEPEGSFTYELNDNFSEKELKVLGPNVKEEHCTALKYYSVKSYSITKNRKTTTTFSNENYPIFIRLCDEFTDLLNVDDAQKYLKFSEFYAVITGNMPVGRKQLKTLEIPFEKSPKLVISSNFSHPNMDSSTMRRLLFVVFSDYYHKQTDENGYLENRQIADDFGYPLHNEHYKAEWWNEDFNFLVDCLQFYLKQEQRNMVIQPPMENVYKRMNIALMGAAFQDWAEVYFSKEGGKLDLLLDKAEAFNDYKMSTQSKFATMHQFIKKLKAFCKNHDEIECYNPKELQNKDGRISRWSGTQTLEKFYIKTKGTPLHFD